MAVSWIILFVIVPLIVVVVIVVATVIVAMCVGVLHTVPPSLPKEEEEDVDADTPRVRGHGFEKAPEGAASLIKVVSIYII